MLRRRDEIPSSQAILKSKWVFKRKEDLDKARLVIKGYADKNFYDTMDVYVPVARLTDVRFLLIIANKYGLEIHQCDIGTAYLNGILLKKVFMELPEGHKDYKNLHHTYVCELQKALYGLKVSGRTWYERFRSTMLKLNGRLGKGQTSFSLFTWDNKLWVALHRTKVRAWNVTLTHP